MLHSQPIDLSAALQCHRCGYDVRAQPGDGQCPECGTPVAESREMAAIPRRPKWRDSDPRWRRRMLAGAWVLVLLPLMSVVEDNQWVALIRLPAWTNAQGYQTLSDSYVSMVYVYLTFCIGVVLLFSKERNRRPGRFDGTRRWGIVACYGVFFLGMIDYAFINSLVTIGISALFMSMPSRLQPGVTDWLAAISGTYVRYGPHPSHLSFASLTAFSAIAILLACVPLYNALRSNGWKVAGLIVLAPLPLAAVAQIGFAIQAVFRNPNVFQRHFIDGRQFFFYARGWIIGSGRFMPSVPVAEQGFEMVKWLTCLVIAVWLSIAQIAAMRRRTRPLPERG